jgi:hypothetical protein
MRASGEKATFQQRSGERGQTIILVAVSLVTLLAMAALAIDVVTLYVARSEMQRAADAAALAGAKAFVDSGVTSLATTNPNYATVQALAQTMATSVIRDILPQNRISGSPPVQAAGSPAFDLTRPGNPQVTVTLQRTDLPTFFARIWGSRLATVSATAIGEAYNPANAPAGYPPIAPKCVKPLLVANRDPASGTQFVDPTMGTPMATNVIGEPIKLRACAAPPCAPAAQELAFRPATVNPGASNLCSSACTPPASDYETSIDCCDSANPPATIYACGSSVLNTVNVLLTDPVLSNESNNGLQCVTNHPAEDTLDPTDLAAGTGPARITAGSGAQSGNLVTTSRSIATLPIVDSATANTVHVIGFLQVFVDKVNIAPTVPTSYPAYILNVVGCGNSPGPPPPVLGGGYSPIPVRLIH